MKSHIKLPVEIFEEYLRELSPAEFKLYLTLLYATHHGLPPLTYRDLIVYTGLSFQTIYRNLRRLKSRGIVRLERHRLCLASG